MFVDLKTPGGEWVSNVADHICPKPNMQVPPERTDSPGNGSIWRCDQCGQHWELIVTYAESVAYWHRTEAL